MARDSDYKRLVHQGMPVAERMALAMSRKTREEWAQQPAGAHEMWGSVAHHMLIQTCDPTDAVIAHARQQLSRYSDMPALTDDQLADIWEAMAFGISAESQNLATGYSKDGGPKQDAA